MAIRNSGEGKQISFALGVDDTSVVDSPEVRGTLSKALNADLVDDSLAKKRNGYAPVNSDAAWGTRRVREGYEYTNSSGTKEVLVYGEEETTTGTSGILGKLNSTLIPSTIVSGLADGVKPSIVQFGTLAFVFNENDDFVYDGTTTRQIGITAPTTAPTFNTTINGDLNQSSTYLFVYTYYNSTTGAESSPSEASAAMTTGGSAITDGIRINVTAGSSTTADYINIYRTVAGGSTFFYDGQTAIASTTYDSTISDGSLGQQLELDNSRPTLCKYAIACDNRLFIAGDSTNPNRVYFSKIGINGAMPESFQAADFADCAITDGDKIIGLNATSNNTVIVLKERSVGRLTRLDNFAAGLELEGSSKYLYEEISRSTTAVNHHSMVSVESLVIWLGKDDVYGTDGVNLLRFGQRIRVTIEDLNFTQPTKFSAVRKTGTKQVIFSVCRAGETEADFQLVGHYRNFPVIAWTYYSPGESTATHPGIRAASMFEFTETSTGKRRVYFGNSNADGYIYLMDTGSDDNTYGIYFDVRLPWDAQSRPARVKMFHSYYTLATGNGSQYNLTHTLEVNNDESIIKTALSPLYDSSNTNWEAANWEDFYWGSLKYISTKFFSRKRAYFARYGVQNINANEPIAIKGITSVVQLDPIHR